MSQELVTNPELERDSEDDLPKVFSDIFAAELQEICERRREAGFDPKETGFDPKDSCKCKDGKLRKNLVGLALSGGGIRSATFCLGLMQVLHKFRLLRIFDYISTVSGGGYLGGWWSAYLARPQFNATDIKDPRGFAAQLLREDPQRLSLKVKQLLEDPRTTDEALTDEALTDEVLDEALVEALIPELNRMLEENGNSDLWSNRIEMQKTYAGYLDLPRFPPPEGIEPDRARRYLGDDSELDKDFAQVQPDMAGSKLAEGSMCAGIDPLHHLRLFANYLTPKRGVLSSDTWAAIAVITRNLMMTWLILLPVLVALILVGQLYYVLRCDDFVKLPPVAETSADTQATSEPISMLAMGEMQTGEMQTGDVQTSQMPENTRSGRLLAACQPLALLAGWVGLMGVLWLLCTIETERLSDSIAVGVGLIAVLAVLYFVVSAYDPSIKTKFLVWASEAQGWISVWLIGAALLILFVFTGSGNAPKSGDPKTITQWRREVRRSKLTRMHSRLLIAFVLTAFVLLLSGFGHDIGDFKIAKNLGWALFLLATVCGSIFTAYKARPSIHDDKAKFRELSKLTHFIFAITPPMVIVALAVIIAWIGHGLLQRMADSPRNVKTDPLTYAPFFVIALCLVFAVFEMRWRKIKHTTGVIAFVTGLAFAFSWVVALMIPNFVIWSESFLLAVLVGIVMVAMIILLIIKSSSVGGEKIPKAKGFKNKLEAFRALRSPRWMITIACVGGAIFLGLKANITITKWFDARLAQPILFLILPLIITTLAGGLALFRLSVNRKKQKNSSRSNFQINLFKNRAGSNELGALWEWGIACVFLSVATDCGIHLLVAHGSRNMLSNEALSFILLPVSVAFLGGCLRFFRLSAVHPEGEPVDDRRLLARIKLSEKSLLVLLAAFMTLSIVAGWLALDSSIRVDADSTSPMMSSTLPWTVSLVVAVFATAIVRIDVGKKGGQQASPLKVFKWQWVNRSMPMLLWLLPFVFILTSKEMGGIARVVIQDFEKEYTGSCVALTNPSFVCVLLCITFLIFEIMWGEDDNRRSLWLLAAAYIVSAALVIIFSHPGHTAGNPKVRLVQATVGLISVALAWVLGLGWMADPNAHSMHVFYKARLVRAYLGASNNNRRLQQKEITEAVAGDNVLLKDMKNCKRGAPYHLINTTLNLVAARDLATAQRSAAVFTLSQLYCGSTRTGYRKTDQYMNGLLSLGTAVAVSGAAASPNMGSRTPTASLAMLMTFLNVRLGFWAPTPGKRDWRLPRPRLWPFYLLREFFSETNDVSDYCYLTDGGHFDNLGLYSLIERGCRYIMVADCGADPEPCFSDLGTTIRRCRIDFRAEIKLDITSLRKLKNRASGHYVEGTVIYSKEHVKRLGWSIDDLESEAERTGKIIFIKPSLLFDRKADETADVRQYAIQNDDFPQQTTTNQWFDEAQFESYRQLGYTCGYSALKDLLEPHDKPASVCPEKDLSLQDIRRIFRDTKNDDPGNTHPRQVS